jgi:hypothetical protein
MANLYNSIIELITNKIEEKGWKEDDDNESFSLELYPFSGLCKYKVRYISATLYKLKNNKYKASVKLENTNYCMLTIEEDDDYYEDKDDFVFFYFNSNELPNLQEAILYVINTIADVKKCCSCNRIHKSTELDKNDICLHCLLESIIQIKDECIICMDSEIPKLHYELSCGHKFHFSCIVKLKKGICPLCRSPFTLKK